MSPPSEDDIELYRNITSLHQRFLVFVACLIDTMQLLGNTFILYLLKLSGGKSFRHYVIFRVKKPSATRKFISVT